MLRHSLRYVMALLLLQILFGVVVFLLVDRVWAALPLTLLFLGLIVAAGRTFSRQGGHASVPYAFLTALLWQLLGLQGSLRFLTDRVGWTAYDGITDLQDFAMETWHTVLLPIFTSVPVGLVDGYYARYYILMVASSPALVILFIAAVFAPGRRFGLQRSKPIPFQ